MKGTKVLLSMGAAVALSGCAVAEDIRASREHKDAQAAYVECLKARQSDCATERAVLDAASAYNAQRVARSAAGAGNTAANAALISAGAAMMQAGQPPQPVNVYVQQPVSSPVYRPRTW